MQQTQPGPGNHSTLQIICQFTKLLLNFTQRCHGWQDSTFRYELSTLLLEISRFPLMISFADNLCTCFNHPQLLAENFHLQGRIFRYIVKNGNTLLNGMQAACAIFLAGHHLNFLQISRDLRGIQPHTEPITATLSVLGSSRIGGVQGFFIS